MAIEVRFGDKKYPSILQAAKGEGLTRTEQNKLRDALGKRGECSIDRGNGFVKVTAAKKRQFDIK